VLVAEEVGVEDAVAVAVGLETDQRKALALPVISTMSEAAATIR